MQRLLIIGGSDAGISAALRARELDRGIRPTVLVSDRFPNYSICGLPFFLSGEVTDFRDLAHRKAEDIEKEGAQLLLEHRAEKIDAAQHVVTVSTPDGERKEYPFDRLIIATGAISTRPPIQGLDLPGVFLLRWMQDSFAVQQWMTDRRPGSAMIIGAGYIGMEMADALTHRGISVTVVEYAPNVLQAVDPDFGESVRAKLEAHIVKVVLGVGVDSISSKNGRLLATGSQGFHLTTDMVIVAVGCTPMTDPIHGSGIETGVKNAIKVDRSLATNFPDIYAAGDCAETWHRLLGKSTYLPLGTTAHKQGRIAAENALGGKRLFQGTLGTQVVKIFDLVVGRTGLREEEAKAAGFDPMSVDTEVWDHKAYYPGAKKMRIRLTGDRKNGRILGAQMMGQYGSEVSKRIDVFATALYHGMEIEEISDLDLSYTPPLSSPWDPVQVSSQAWMTRWRANE